MQSVVQPYSPSKVNTEFRPGFQGCIPLHLESLHGDCTTCLDILFHGWTVLMGKRFLLTSSLDFSCFNLGPLSVVLLLCTSYKSLVSSCQWLPCGKNSGGLLLGVLKLSLVQGEQAEHPHPVLAGPVLQPLTILFAFQVCSSLLMFGAGGTTGCNAEQRGGITLYLPMLPFIQTRMLGDLIAARAR